MKNVAKMEKIDYKKLPLRALRKQLKLRNNRVYGIVRYSEFCQQQYYYYRRTNNVSLRWFRIVV